MPQTYHVKLSDGREFNVTTEGGPPSESDVLSGLKTEAPKPESPFLKSRGIGTEPEPSFLSKLVKTMEPMAHPQGLGDFASALLPATGFGTGVGALRGWGTAAKNLFQGASEGAANREGLKKLPAAFQGMKNVATDVVSGRDRAFQDAPLVQQMESLPARGAMPTGRPNVPPMSSMNPNDLPLWKQMEQMTEGPAGPLGGGTRSGMPRMMEGADTGLEAQVADAARRNKLSPEAQGKLLKQLQMSNLVKIGPET